ncbi:hypothetical protein, partial [Komagataeibacter nataicola]|uniref:hypothetical protein n=2 Tax=Komagataeibacter nataicola TaxID=265960 RepID=UPI002231036E
LQPPRGQRGHFWPAQQHYILMGTPAAPHERGWSGAIVLLLMVLLLVPGRANAPHTRNDTPRQRKKSTGPH